MSVDTEYGYLELPYLTWPYLTGVVTHAVAAQVDRRIDAAHTAWSQVAASILDFPHTVAGQVERIVGAGAHTVASQVDQRIDDDHTAMSQVDRRIDDDHTIAGQVDRDTSASHITRSEAERRIDDDHAIGEQIARMIAGATHLARSEVERRIDQTARVKRTEIRRGTVVHELCEDGGYLALPYLTMPYLTGVICARARTQVARTIAATHVARAQIQRQIADRRHVAFAQVERRIDATHDVRGQIDRIRATLKGSQITQVLYNTDNLRIMLDFPSRGSTQPGGTNAWGNPTAQGENWVANSTYPGDFAVANVNTDIVEQCWRGAADVRTALELKCDAEVNQGIFLDTLAILNHNLTTSASVVLQGTNDYTFSTVDFAESLTVTADDMYYIAPTLPNASYRYWRLLIDDPTNRPTDTTAFIQIGTIIFGSAIIFQGECFVDQVSRGRKHFADVVRTEGFTNVSNDRALKRTVGLEFRNLKFNRGNYLNLVEVFETARTSLKCLWIPTPRFPGRFAIFGKLPTLPTEQHNVKGEDLDFVSFSIEVDESL